VAKAVTDTRAAAVGLPPAGQPVAAATCKVGISVWRGGGSCGFAPTLVGGDATGPLCEVAAAQAASASRTAIDRAARTGVGRSMHKLLSPLVGQQSWRSTV
jgi:hypothetical protein